MLALKLLPRGPNYTKENLGRMKHEYFVGREMNHENIIRTFDFGSGREGTFLVMELFQVRNLKQWLNIGVEQIAHLTEEIIHRAAEGLAQIHKQGWIHCDIKPDNLLVSDDGQVKLIDFSLAQRRRGRWGRWFSGRSKIQGTKSYMAPEQIRGRAVDERSDIYSLGCVVHEMVSGKPPFTGTNANELLTKHLRSIPPSLEAINKNVHSQFSQFVTRLMAKDPRQRPPTMEDLLAELKGTRIFQRRPTPPSKDAVDESRSKE